MKGMKTLSMVLLAAGIMLTACNKKEPVQQVKQNGLPKAGQTAQQIKIYFYRSSIHAWHEMIDK